MSADAKLRAMSRKLDDANFEITKVECEGRANLSKAKTHYRKKLDNVKKELDNEQKERVRTANLLRQERDAGAERDAAFRKMIAELQKQLSSAQKGAANAFAQAGHQSGPSAAFSPQHDELEARPSQEKQVFTEYEELSNVFSGEDGTNPGIAMCFFTRTTEKDPDHNGNRKFSFEFDRNHNPKTPKHWNTKGSDVLWRKLNDVSYTVPEKDLKQSCKPNNYAEAKQARELLKGKDLEALEVFADRFRGHFAFEVKLLPILNAGGPPFCGGEMFPTRGGRNEFLHGTAYVIMAVPAWSGLVLNEALDAFQREGIRRSSPHGSTSPEAEEDDKRILELHKARRHGGHPPLSSIMSYLLKHCRKASFPLQFKDWVDHQLHEGELEPIPDAERNIWNQQHNITKEQKKASLSERSWKNLQDEVELFTLLTDTIDKIKSMLKNVKQNTTDSSAPNNCDTIVKYLASLVQKKIARQGHFSGEDHVWQAFPRCAADASTYWGCVQKRYTGKKSYTSNAQHLVSNEGEEDSAGKTKFVFSQDAVAFLEPLPGPFYITVIAGSQRSGKSELMNRTVQSMMGSIRGATMGSSFFQTSGNHESCTRGAWFIAAPHPSGVGTVLFVDSEGTGSTSKNATHDSLIVMVTYMLCQSLIYRGTKLDDTDAVQKMKQYLQIAIGAEAKVQQTAMASPNQTQRRNLLLMVKDSAQADRDFSANKQKEILQSIFTEPGCFEDLNGHSTSEFYPANKNVHLHLGGVPLPSHTLSQVSRTPWHALSKEYRAPVWRFFENVSKCALGLRSKDSHDGCAERLYDDAPETDLNMGAPMRNSQGEVIHSGTELVREIYNVTKAVDTEGIYLPSINASLQDQKMKDGASRLLQGFQRDFVSRLQSAPDQFPIISRSGWVKSDSGRGSVWERGTDNFAAERGAATSLDGSSNNLEDHALRDVSRLDFLSDYSFTKDKYVRLDEEKPGEIRAESVCIEDFAMYPVPEEELRRHYEALLDAARKRFHLPTTDPERVVDFVIPGAEGTQLMKQVGEAKYLVEEGFEREYAALRQDNEDKARSLAKDVLKDRFDAYVKNVSRLWQFCNEDQIGPEDFSGVARFQDRVKLWEARVRWLLQYRVSEAIVDEAVYAFKTDTIKPMEEALKQDITHAKAKYLKYVKDDDTMQLDRHPDFAIGMYTQDLQSKRWALAGCSDDKAQFLFAALKQDIWKDDSGAFPQQIVDSWQRSRHLDQLVNVTVARYLSCGLVLVMTYPLFSGLLPQKVVQSSCGSSAGKYLELIWENVCTQTHPLLVSLTSARHVSHDVHETLKRLQNALIERAQFRHKHGRQMSQPMQLIVPEEEKQSLRSKTPHRRYRVHSGAAEWFRQSVGQNEKRSENTGPREVVEGDSGNELSLLEEDLHQSPGPIATAAITGHVRGGKSFLFGLLAEKLVGKELLPQSWQETGGFNISSQVSSFTKGAWVVAIPNPNNNGWLLLVDCEGTESCEKAQSGLPVGDTAPRDDQSGADARLFSAVFACASVFMYNKKGPVTEKSGMESMKLLLDIANGLKEVIKKEQEGGDPSRRCGDMTRSLILVSRDYNCAYRDADESYRTGILREAFLGEKASTVSQLTEETDAAADTAVAAPNGTAEAFENIGDVSLFLMNKPHAEVQSCEVMKTLPFTDFDPSFISPFKRLQRELTSKLSKDSARLQFHGSDICTGAQLIDYLSFIVEKLNTSGTDIIPEMGGAGDMIQRNNLQSKRALLLKYLDTALEDYSEGRVEGEGVSGFPMPAAQFEKVYNDARQGVLDNFGKEVWQLNTPAGRANFEDAKNEIISECDSKYAKSCRLNTERGRKWAQDEIALHWERDIQDPFYSGRYTFGGGREGPQSRELDPVVNVCDPAVDVTAVMNMRPQDTGDCPRVKLFLKDVQTLERKLREEVLPVRCADVSIIDKAWLQHSEANVEAMRAQLRSRNQSSRQSWYERKIREHELRKTQAEVEKAKQETAQVKDKNSREMAAMRADNAQLEKKAAEEQIAMTKERIEELEALTKATKRAIQQVKNNAKQKREARAKKEKKDRDACEQKIKHLQAETQRLAAREPTKTNCWAWGALCFDGAALISILRTEFCSAGQLLSRTEADVPISQLNPRTDSVCLLDGRIVRVLAVTASSRGRKRLSRVRSICGRESTAITEDHGLVAELSQRVEILEDCDAETELDSSLVYDLVLDPADLAQSGGSSLPGGRFSLSVQEAQRSSEGNTARAEYIKRCGADARDCANALIPVAFAVDGVYVTHSLPVEFSENPIATLVTLNTVAPLVIREWERASCDTERDAVLVQAKQIFDTVMEGCGRVKDDSNVLVSVREAVSGVFCRHLARSTLDEREMVAEDFLDASAENVAHSALWMKVTKHLLKGFTQSSDSVGERETVDFAVVQQLMVEVAQQLQEAFPQCMSDTSFESSDSSRELLSSSESESVSEDENVALLENDVDEEGRASAGEAPDVPTGPLSSPCTQHTEGSLVLRPFITAPADGTLRLHEGTVREFVDDVSNCDSSEQGDLLAFVDTGDSRGACGTDLLQAAAGKRGLSFPADAPEQNPTSFPSVMLAWGLGHDRKIHVYLLLPYSAVQCRSDVPWRKRSTMASLHESVLTTFLSLTTDVLIDVRGAGSVCQGGAVKPQLQGIAFERFELLLRCVGEHQWSVLREASVLQDLTHLAACRNAEHDNLGSQGSTTTDAGVGTEESDNPTEEDEITHILIMPTLTETREQVLLREELERSRREDLLQSVLSEEVPQSTDGEPDDTYSLPSEAAVMREEPRVTNKVANYVTAFYGLETYAREYNTTRTEYPERGDLEAHVSSEFSKEQERMLCEMSASLRCETDSDHMDHVFKEHARAHLHCTFLAKPSAQKEGHEYVASQGSFVQSVFDIQLQRRSAAGCGEACGGWMAWLREVAHLAAKASSATSVEEMIENNDALGSAIVSDLVGASAALKHRQRVAEQCRCLLQSLDTGVSNIAAWSCVNPMAARLKLASVFEQTVRPILDQLAHDLHRTFESERMKFFCELGFDLAGRVSATWKDLVSDETEAAAKVHDRIFNGHSRADLMARFQSKIVEPLLSMYKKDEEKLRVQDLTQRDVRELDANYFTKVEGFLTEKGSEVDTFLQAQEKLHARAVLEKGTAWNRVQRNLSSGECTTRLIEFHIDRLAAEAARRPAVAGNAFDLGEELKRARTEFFHNTTHFLRAEDGQASDELKAKYFLEFMSERSMKAIADVVDFCGKTGGQACHRDLQARSACAQEELKLLHGLAEMYTSCAKDQRRMMSELRQVKARTERNLEAIHTEMRAAHDAHIASLHRTEELMKFVTRLGNGDDGEGWAQQLREGNIDLTGVDPAFVSVLQEAVAEEHHDRLFYAEKAEQCEELQKVINEVHAAYDELDRQNERGVFQSILGAAMGVVGGFLTPTCPTIGPALVSCGANSMMNQGQPWDEYFKGHVKVAVASAVTAGCGKMLGPLSQGAQAGNFLTQGATKACVSGAISGVAANVLDGRNLSEGLGAAMICGAISSCVPSVAGKIADTKVMQEIVSSIRKARAVEMAIGKTGQLLQKVTGTTLGSLVTNGKVDFAETCRNVVASDLLEEGFHLAGNPQRQKIQKQQAQERQTQKQQTQERQAQKQQAEEKASKMTFKEAFRIARKNGESAFEWNTKKYTTDMIPDPPKVPASYTQLPTSQRDSINELLAEKSFQSNVFVFDSNPTAAGSNDHSIGGLVQGELLNINPIGLPTSQRDSINELLSEKSFQSNVIVLDPNPPTEGSNPSIKDPGADRGSPKDHSIVDALQEQHLDATLRELAKSDPKHVKLVGRTLFCRGVAYSITSGYTRTAKGEKTWIAVVKEIIPYATKYSGGVAGGALLPNRGGVQVGAAVGECIGKVVVYIWDWIDPPKPKHCAKDVSNKRSRHCR